jgi:uncharacterized Zn-finger protein
LEGGQQYWCCPQEGCRKAYSKGYELRLHIMKHYDKKLHACDYPDCGWKFVTPHKLARHRRRHTAAPKEFVCCMEECGKRFTTLYNLQAHIRDHSRLFPCQTCSQTFNTRRSLDEHTARWA